MTIYLEDRRREAGDWLLKLQHVVGGVPIFIIGFHHVRGEGGTSDPMGWLEIAIAAGVFATFLKELIAARRKRNGQHAGAAHAVVGWFDIAAGVLLLFEAFHGAHVKPGYLRPQFFAGVLALSLGAFHGRFAALRHRARYLQIDERGIAYRLRPFQKRSVAREEIASLTVEKDTLTIHEKNGQTHAVNFKRFANRDAALKALADHPAVAELLLRSPRPN